MNIGNVSPALAPVIAEAAEATPLVQDGIDAAPVTTHGPEGAAAQTLLRPQTQSTDTQTARTQDALPGTDAPSESALPTAQLVPVTLVGLAIDTDTWWMLPRDPASHADAPALPEDEATAPADWRVQLARAVRKLLTAAEPPPGLAVAREEWRRGRLVALACPRGIDPAGAAWLYLVVRRADESIDGVRLPARLRWLISPRENPWLHARLIKHYHPQRGRELAGPDAADDRLPCIIQLGPVMPAVRSCVCVRVEPVERFWATLDVQWSVLAVVAARPIAESGS